MRITEWNDRIEFRIVKCKPIQVKGWHTVYDKTMEIRWGRKLNPSLGKRQRWNEVNVWQKLVIKSRMKWDEKLKKFQTEMTMERPCL